MVEMKQCLSHAWRHSVAQAYAGQMVHGERGLLVQFAHQLMQRFEADAPQRRLYVDPVFLGPEGRLRVPDLAICWAGQVVALVMLQHQPRQAPEVEKAMATLRGFAALAGRDLLLAQERYLGPGEDLLRQYTLAPDALLCWAGLYRGPQARDLHATDLGERFLGLHALTEPHKPPKLHGLVEGD